MPVTLVESEIERTGSDQSTQTVNFSAQPSAGNEWVVGSAIFFPPSSPAQHTVTAPASLTSRQDERAGGNLSMQTLSKVSSGSDGTASTTNVTTGAEGLGTIALNLSGAAYDTSGKATTNSATSLAFASAGNVAVDGSTAYALVSKPGQACTVSMSGWTLLAEVRTTTSSLVEMFLYSKTVNSGAPASGTFVLDTGAGNRIKVQVVVMSPVDPPTAVMTSPPGSMEIYQNDVVNLEGDATGGDTPYKNWSWSVQEGGSGTTPVTTQDGTMAFPHAGTWTLELTVDGDDDQTSDPVTRTITVLSSSVGGGGVIVGGGGGSSDQRDAYVQIG